MSITAGNLPKLADQVATTDRQIRVNVGLISGFC